MDVTDSEAGCARQFRCQRIVGSISDFGHVLMHTVRDITSHRRSPLSTVVNVIG